MFVCNCVTAGMADLLLKTLLGLCCEKSPWHLAPSQRAIQEVGADLKKG